MLFPGDQLLSFKNFETTPPCQYNTINVTHKHTWRKVYRQVVLHISVLFKQKRTVPLYQQYLNRFMIKQRRK